MNVEVIRALVLLELRRGLAPNARLIGAFAAGTAVMAALRWLTPSRFAWLLALIATTLFMQVPMCVLRDKLDGGMEFLVSLPVSSSSLAAGRLLAGAISCLPGSLALAVAIRLWVPEASAAVPGGMAAVAGGLWIASALACCLLVAVACRFEARTTLYVPIVSGLVAVALDELAPGVVPDPLVAAGWLLRRPWAPAVLWIAGTSVVVLLAWLSLRVARTGIARFEQGRDRITW